MSTRVAALAPRLLLSGLAVIAIGCGDPCEDAAAEICARACECGGSECPASFFNKSGVGATLTFDSEDDCAALFQQGCAEEAEDGFDAEACLDAAPDASCGDADQGVLVPAACQ